MCFKGTFSIILVIFPQFLITMAATKLIPNNIVKEDHSVMEDIGFSSALNLWLQCKGRFLEGADTPVFGFSSSGGARAQENVPLRLYTKFWM